MLIRTSDTKTIYPFLNKLYIPPANSHKGQNGRVLVIGGSSLFHAASIWAAEIASRFVDIVHYASTKENGEVFLTLKKKFQNGIIVPQKEIDYYIKEDEAVLIGPGMVREGEEGEYTRDMTRSLIKKFLKKRFVFDAGSLQTMDADWLKELKTKPIITPHQIEFEKLFNIPIHKKSLDEKIKIVRETAKKFNSVILLKAIVDIVSDGKNVYIVEGGNAGLTKGGTGDALAGLAVALFAKNMAVESAVLASFILKKTADTLSSEKGYWYNISDIIDNVANVLVQLKFNL